MTKIHASVEPLVLGILSKLTPRTAVSLYFILRFRCYPSCAEGYRGTVAYSLE